LNRRELLRTTLAGAAGVSLDVEAQESKAAASKSRTKLPPGAAITNAEIYKLLGYATMTGEDPLRMWARLQATRNGWSAHFHQTPGQARCSSRTTLTSLRSDFAAFRLNG